VTFATPELRYEVEESRKFGVIEAVAQALAAEGADPVSIDGVRVKEADGWWLLRASNTQAALVGRAEGASQAAVDRMREGIETRLRKLGIEPILGDH
jgi:phosphomannomutase